MVRKMGFKWISCFLSICMILTLIPNSIVLAQGEGAMNVNGSELQMWIGDTQVCDTNISVSNGEVREFNGNRLCRIYSGDEYDVYAGTNGEGKAEQLYIQPTCTDGTLDIPGIRILGRGEVCLLCSVMDGVAESEQITVNLNAYMGEDTTRQGYAVYSEFFAEEDGGGRSDKVKFSFNDGAIHTDEATGDVSGSSVNVNGTIKATSISSMDVVAINFGSEEKTLDYALEFVYGQAFNAEWDVDGYYEIEIKDANNDNDSEKILGNVETMRVMTGGSINIVGEETTEKDIEVPKNVRASYFSSLGTYRKIVQNGERIQNFVETVECVVDSDAEGYNAETNPTPHKDTEGRYIG